MRWVCYIMCYIITELNRIILIFRSNTPPTGMGNTNQQENGFILYRRRWFILLIFSLISMTNQVMWIILGSVSTTMKNYFQVEYTSINWLGMIFCVLTPAVVLAVYVLNRYGLKVVIVCGALSNTIASSLKLIGYTRNGYTLQLIGNGFGGLGQAFLFFIPPTLAATWFGEKERIRASAIAMFMNTVGIAVGFLLGSLLIPASTDYEGAVKDGMFVSLLSVTAFCVLLLILSIIFIRKSPPTPPTKTQEISRIRRITKQVHTSQIEVGITNATFDEDDNVLQEGIDNHDNEIDSSQIHVRSVDDDLEHNIIMQSTGLQKNWRYLMRMPSFHLLLHSYGIYFALLSCLCNVLNQVVIEKFPSHEKFIGLMGCSCIVCGIFGTLLSGILIDRTHRYKIVSITIFTCCVFTFLGFTLILKYSGNFTLTFVTFCIFGLCASPFVTVGMEYLTEIVYPVKESNISFIMLLVGVTYTFSFTYILGMISQKFGSDIVCYIVTGLYTAGLICIALVRGELKRIGIDSGSQVGNRSAAQVTSRPTQETNET